MAKRKTKKQKKRAQARRRQQVLSTHQEPTDKENLKQKSQQNEDVNSVKENTDDVQYLKEDLKKTALITAVIIIILTILVSTQDQWQTLIPSL